MLPKKYTMADFECDRQSETEGTKAGKMADELQSDIQGPSVSTMALKVIYIASLPYSMRSRGRSESAEGGRDWLTARACAVPRKRQTHVGQVAAKETRFSKTIQVVREVAGSARDNLLHLETLRGMGSFSLTP